MPHNFTGTLRNPKYMQLARFHRPRAGSALPRLRTTCRRSLAEQLGSVGRPWGSRCGPAVRPSNGARTQGGWQRRVSPAASDHRSLDDPWSRDEPLARLEAVLFLAREPLGTRKLAQFAHLADGTEARTLIRRLNRIYDESGCAFRAEEVAGGFQLMSRAQFGSWLRRLYEPAQLRLSAPALETLAVVAYRQPVMRAEIEAVRGVDCGEILRQLMDRDLVRTAGRAHELGRPYRYATTKRFLQIFGLRYLDDLPRAEQLRIVPAAGMTPSSTIQDDPASDV